MAVWYLDNDDEITDAVARLRSAADEHVVFVVPPGSRIATGRINFKLLAREAESRALTMAIASPDDQVRALATSAGVLAAVTPDEAEAALERGDEAPVAAPPTGREPSADADTTPEAVALAPADERLMWRSQRRRVAVVATLVAAIVLAFVGLQTLPTAEITLTPRIVSLEPLELTVTASTESESIDAGAGTVPAVSLPIPLAVDDTYPASGVVASETHATGEVVFSAAAQAFDQEIAAGTRVLTPAGIAFRTTESVILPRSASGPSEVRAPVEALGGGTDGNVPAEAISVVPSLEGQGIGVTNPEPTAGGRLEETALVTAADYDAAAVDLRNRLAGALAAHLRGADVPEGLTLFPETAKLGTVRHSPPAEDVVGTAASEFALAASAAASVLAVDERQVDEVSRAQLLEAVPSDRRVIAESVSVSHEEGVVDGDRITFTSLATGRTTPDFDAEDLRTRMAGLPVSDARSILDGIGSATVNVWPGFLGDLPNDRDRITLDVLEASATE